MNIRQKITDALNTIIPAVEIVATETEMRSLIDAHESIKSLSPRSLDWDLAMCRAKLNVARDAIREIYRRAEYVGAGLASEYHYHVRRGVREPSMIADAKSLDGVRSAVWRALFDVARSMGDVSQWDWPSIA